MRTFEGRTVDVDAPYLGAEFWTEGKKVTGFVTKVEQNLLDGRMETSYTLDLAPEVVVVDGEETERVRIGSLSGFKKAIEAAGVTALVRKDVITLTCEGLKLSKKEGYSARINFHLKVDRA